jgi:hypothetical protein
MYTKIRALIPKFVIRPTIYLSGRLVTILSKLLLTTYSLVSEEGDQLDQSKLLLKCFGQCGR